ncbi:MAG: gp436 family protein [Arenicellales bacterium]
MAYITTQELIERFGKKEMLELADPHETGSIDATVVDAAIDDASALIDGFVSKGGYDLPLSSVPRTIKRICADITRYYLWDDSASDRVLELHKDGITWLKDLAAGRTELGEETPPDGSAVAPTGHVATQVGASNIDWDSY